MFGAALEDRTDSIEDVEKLRGKLTAGLMLIEGTVINEPESYVPHIVSVSFEGHKGRSACKAAWGKGGYIYRGQVLHVLKES